MYRYTQLPYRYMYAMRIILLKYCTGSGWVAGAVCGAWLSGLELGTGNWGTTPMIDKSESMIQVNVYY